jgi:2-polyprenyl-3-methyl-5-hydroxy-6-metoxy-1,4-benzoquinol methylase
MKCETCLSKNLSYYTVTDSSAAVIASGMKCSNCGYIHLDLAQKDYTEWDGISFYLQNRAWFDNKYDYLLEEIFYHTKKRNFEAVCDFGCGPGFFLQKMAIYSNRNLGVELNPHFIEYINKQKVNILMVEPEVYMKSTERFEIILFDNVLEHLDNFDVVIKNSWDKLVPGGLMIISVPQVDWARLFLQKFKPIKKSTYSNLNIFNDVHEHVNYFTNETIKSYFSRIEGATIVSKRFHHKIPKQLRFIFSDILHLSTGNWFIKKND